RAVGRSVGLYKLGAFFTGKTDVRNGSFVARPLLPRNWNPSRAEETRCECRVPEALFAAEDVMENRERETRERGGDGNGQPWEWNERGRERGRSMQGQRSQEYPEYGPPSGGQYGEQGRYQQRSLGQGGQQQNYPQ